MYTQITNPVTNRKVSVYGKIGIQVLKNYIYTMNGGAALENSHDDADQRSRKKVNFNPNVDSQKKCQLGNVIFPKKALPSLTYLSEYKNINSLGCTNDTYPSYKDGKYCCVRDKTSDQELFDYINNLIINSLETLGEEMYLKSSSIKSQIYHLIIQRYTLLCDNNKLQDPNNDLLYQFLTNHETVISLDETDSLKKNINQLLIIGGGYMGFKLPQDIIQKLGTF